MNLKKGVNAGETVEACTAGAGTLLLEFGVLSRLLGDDKYEVERSLSFLPILPDICSVLDGLCCNSYVTFHTETGE